MAGLKNVIPTQAGIQQRGLNAQKSLDSRLRGNDGLRKLSSYFIFHPNPVQPTSNNPFKAAAGISQAVPAPRQPAAHCGGASWLRALSEWTSSV